MTRTTTDRRRDYTPEQREAERQYRVRYREENKERLALAAAERRSAGKCKGTSYYRAKQTQEHREKELAQKRKRYQENREAALAYAADYRAKNLDKCRAHDIGRYARNKEYFDAYREKNAERIRENRAKWTEANRERIAATNAAWLQNNLDKHRTHQHNRRAKKKANGGTLSPDIACRLLVAQRGKCACCKSKLGDKFHIDHIVPIARGGMNADDNVQLLCAHCNLSKGSKHPVDFMQSRGMLL